MKLILLINFINELLDMKEEELKKLHHYLEGLLNLNQGEEVELLMDEENEKNIVLPEINEEEIDYKKQEIKEDEAIEEEITTINNETPKLIDELAEVKEELINFKDVLNEYQDLEPLQTGSFNLEITKNFLKGGDNKMAEEIENCGCVEAQAFGDPGCCGCDVPVIEYPETIEIDDEIEFCCVTCVPENFFDEDQLGADDIGLPEINYQLNKVNCCIEQRDVIDEFECEKRVCVGKAVGCIELGLIAFPLANNQKIPRPDDSGNVVVCCNTCICINNIISAICEDQAECPCDDLQVEITDLSVVDTPCGENTREVLFTGTVTLSTP